MKNLISTLFLGGALAIGGCSSEKRIFKDFNNFLRDKGERDNFSENPFDYSLSCYNYSYEDTINKKTYTARVYDRYGKLEETRVMINFMEPNWESWSDRQADGLDKLDSYGKEGLGKEESPLKRFSKEKRFEIKKRCADELKQIMRNEKYRDY